MAHHTSIGDVPHELAHRTVDGLQVSLVWHRSTNRTSVLVRDAATGDAFELAVGNAPPLDVFHHPYAYAAHRGIAYAAGQRAPETVGAAGEELAWADAA